MHPNNLQQFQPSRLSAAAALVKGMDPVSRERLTKRNEVANLARTDKPFPVEPVMQGFVKRANHLPRLPRPESARLIEEIRDRNQSGIKGNRRTKLASSRPIIKQFASAIQDQRFVHIAGKNLRNGIEGVRQVKIIAIEPTENISRGTLKAFVDCRRLATVLAGAPKTQLGIILLKDCERPVLAPAIQNLIFKFRIFLLKHAQNRLLDELALIVGGSNNGNSWIGHNTL